MKHHRGVISTIFDVAAGTVAVLSLSCGGGKSSSGPTTLPTPIPTPKPTATPSASAGCHLGPGVYHPEEAETVSQLLPYLEAAMDQLIAQKPQIFDLKNESSPLSQAYYVVDRNAYLNGLVANLQASGLCAQLDVDANTQDIVWAKISNDYSEEFKVILGSGHMRRGAKAYRLTYLPANFPVARPADDPPLGSGCYKPFPPELTRMSCKLNLKLGEYDQLDSTPIVSGSICDETGQGELEPGVPRWDCPIRPEGWEGGDRVACENLRTGISRHTGRPGPTWTNTEGQLCGDPIKGPANGCMVSPDSAYQLWVYDKQGVYTVKAQTGDDCHVNLAELH